MTMHIDLDYNIGDKVYRLYGMAIKEYTINSITINIYSNGKAMIQYQVFGNGVQSYYTEAEMETKGYYRSKKEILKKIAEQL